MCEPASHASHASHIASHAIHASQGASHASHRFNVKNNQIIDITSSNQRLGVRSLPVIIFVCY